MQLHHLSALSPLPCPLSWPPYTFPFYTNNTSSMSVAEVLQLGIRIGVIGGSGLYNLRGIEVVTHVHPDTPWGKPSSPITVAKLPSGVHIAFLARHGLSHEIPPNKVPSLANIAALKSLGVLSILAFSAVGSLREEIRPKDVIVPSQILDRTKGIRRASFFGDGEESNVVAHAMFGDPFDEHLRPIVEKTVKDVLAKADADVKVHGDKTVVCMEGPAFSTRAESIAYRQLGGDIINMSVLPEAKLAREAELGYVLVATSTDYDAWRVNEHAVTVEQVMQVLHHNVAASQEIVLGVLDTVHAHVADPASASNAALKGSMKYAVVTKPHAIPAKAKQNLSFILPEYFS